VSESLSLHSAFLTDVGRKRRQNQDNGIALPELGLFVVADGMGGHQGGETASAMVVELLPRLVQEFATEKELEISILANAIQRVNAEVYAKSQQTPELRGMGTTTTAAWFQANTLSIAQVGDSRCYFIRPDGIWQLTRDHSLVAEKVRAGLITYEQAKTDRMKNVITRSVGFESAVSVETFTMPIEPNDAFLLCSDGLSGLLSDEEIFRIFQNQLFEKQNAQQTATDLIALANEHGGDDNITAIVVHAVAPTAGMGEK
jgi:protein phosphatase